MAQRGEVGAAHRPSDFRSANVVTVSLSVACSPFHRSQFSYQSIQIMIQACVLNKVSLN